MVWLVLTLLVNYFYDLFQTSEYNRVVACDPAGQIAPGALRYPNNSAPVLPIELNDMMPILTGAPYIYGYNINDTAKYWNPEYANKFEVRVQVRVLV